MALYAFDGTWNKDKAGTERDTNVIWFRDAYASPVHYLKGVGTKFGKLGKVVGGITGAGGRSRVKKMVKKLRAAVAKGDTTIDIVGFSRGAALALHFANKIDSGDALGTPAGKAPPIRFLGLWDTVPAFGLPSTPANVGWDLDLPDNVEVCYHALSLDERRHTFKPERLEARVESTDQPNRLYEVWFRGVHSDIGGGNKNTGLSSIALNWMFAAAKRHGLPISAAAVTRNRKRRKKASPISVHSFDPIKNKFRVVRGNDRIHESVAFRADSGKRKHNNPPAGVVAIADSGRQVRKFKRA